MQMLLPDEVVDLAREAFILTVEGEDFRHVTFAAQHHASIPPV
jgi:hypothetical protein